MKFGKVSRISLFIISLIMLVGMLALYYISIHVLPYSALRPRRAIPNLEIAKETLFAKGYTLDSIKINSNDTISLSGWLIHPKNEFKSATIILFHGIGSNRLGMLDIADFLLSNGYSCALFDHRAHGYSGGDNCTFGYFEKYDYRIILDTLSTRLPKRNRYGVLGHSLGAAIALQFMAFDERIEAGIFESCFTDYRQITQDYFHRLAGIRLEYIVNLALNESEKIAKYKVDNVSPLTSVKSINRPSLFIHGKKDSRISYSYGKSLYEHCPTPQKTLYLIDYADHNNVHSIGGDSLKAAILDFLNKNLNGVPEKKF